MVKVISGYDEVVRNFVLSRVDEIDLKNGYTTLGVVDDNNDLIFGVVYYDYRKPVDIQVCIAADKSNWANRETLNILFGYPFRQLNCRRMTAIISKKNKKSRSICERLGFVYEGNARKAMNNGDDAIIYGLLKEDCKWLLQPKQEYGIKAA